MFPRWGQTHLWVHWMLLCAIFSNGFKKFTLDLVQLFILNSKINWSFMPSGYYCDLVSVVFYSNTIYCASPGVNFITFEYFCPDSVMKSLSQKGTVVMEDSKCRRKESEVEWRQRCSIIQKEMTDNEVCNPKNLNWRWRPSNWADYTRMEQMNQHQLQRDSYWVGQETETNEQSGTSWECNQRTETVSNNHRMIGRTRTKYRAETGRSLLLRQQG